MALPADLAPEIASVSRAPHTVATLGTEEDRLDFQIPQYEFR